MGRIDDKPPPRFLAWPAIAAQQPELASAGARVFGRVSPAHLATVSKLGRPRLSRVCVAFNDDALLIALDGATGAARELRENPFFDLHAGPGFLVEGVAIRGWAGIVSDGREAVFELFADEAYATPAAVEEWREKETR
jgi:hypothetical protein